MRFFISYIKQLPGSRRNYIKDKHKTKNNKNKCNKTFQNKTLFPVFVLCNKSCWHKHYLNSVMCSIPYNCYFSLFSLTSFTLTIQSAITYAAVTLFELPEDTRTAHKLQQAFRLYKLLKAPERAPDTSETTNSKGSFRNTSCALSPPSGKNADSLKCCVIQDYIIIIISDPKESKTVCLPKQSHLNVLHLLCNFNVTAES